MKKIYDPLQPDKIEELKGQYKNRWKFLKSSKQSLKVSTDQSVQAQRMIMSSEYELMKIRMALKERGIGVLLNRRNFDWIEFKGDFVFINLNSLNVNNLLDYKVCDALKKQDEEREKNAIEYVDWLKSIGC